MMRFELTVIHPTGTRMFPTPNWEHAKQVMELLIQMDVTFTLTSYRDSPN